MKYIKYDKNALKEMRMFLLLWSTQALSGLGSAMTAYALVIWSYTQKGSALTTALLMVSSYAPYVIFSIFAGALSDKWNKKTTMMVCDAAAAFTTVVMLILLRNDALMIWHLYALNAVNGLMNTVQQPASEVATTRILPKKYYQRVGGLRYLAGSLTSIMTPVIATAVMGIGGMEAVAAVDLCSFGIAFLALLFLIRIPEKEERAENEEKLLCAVRKGVGCLKKERGVFDLILFLAAINLVASVYNAAFPAMMLSRNGGSETALGLVNAVIGIAMFAGSLLASLMKTPEEMQGRVYSVRNSLQFFTIPIGYLLGGFLVDSVFEPIMVRQKEGSFLLRIFGSGKGSGAAFLFFLLAFAGIGVCLYFRHDQHIWDLEKEKRSL